MATVFVTFVHSIAITTLAGFDIYADSVRDAFVRSWNYAVKNYFSGQEEDVDIGIWRISDSDVRDHNGNVHNFIFNEDKELPEDSFRFLNILKDYLYDLHLKIIVVDKVTRQREIFE